MRNVAFAETTRAAVGPRGVAPVVAIILCASAAMPLLYRLVAFHGAWLHPQPAEVRWHVAFNCLANFLVAVGALQLTGRVDRRLSQVVLLALLCHGAVAFLTLVLRLYYSIPMLLTGPPCSLMIGWLIVVVRRSDGPRIGVVGSWHPVMEDRGLRCEPITDPDASIRPYAVILITDDGAIASQWSSLVARALLAGKTVRHASEYMEERRGVVSAEHFELDHLPEAGLTSYRATKRFLDVLFVLLLAPVAAPILVFAAVGVWLSMGSPILFTQVRLGLGGRPFTMIKLRTMRSIEGAAPVATDKQDPRITSLGRWLRHFHIDELPQLWNVLIGQMSVVGPRPEQPALADSYEREAPTFAYRHIVRPGITGWAQIKSGYAADLAETQVKLGFDLYYLKNFSLGLDLQILARTVWTVISRRGAR